MFSGYCHITDRQSQVLESGYRAQGSLSWCQTSGGGEVDSGGGVAPGTVGHGLSSPPASGEGQCSAGLRAALLCCGIVVFLGLLSVSWRADLGLGPLVGRAVCRCGDRGSIGSGSLQAADLLRGGLCPPKVVVWPQMVPHRRTGYWVGPAVGADAPPQASVRP